MCAMCPVWFVDLNHIGHIEHIGFVDHIGFSLFLRLYGQVLQMADCFSPTDVESPSVLCGL